MLISGFTIIRNAVIYDFQIIEAIKSVLDIVDEFVVVAGDSDDNTDELLATIESPKLRIIRSDWDVAKYKDNGTIYAAQTDIALKACKGDWCLYIQSDEVLHEKSLPIIKDACMKYRFDEKVDGFVLNYVHMYADYKHYIDALHFAYPYEIRIVRNRDDIHSWRDAQSFRSMQGFDYNDYSTSEGTSKLRCIVLDNTLMFHYGWSRDPRCMVKKCAAQFGFYFPDQENMVANVDYHDYGNVSTMPLYTGSQPAVMQERIEAMDWQHLLRYSGPNPDMKKKFKLKYRILSFFENKILGGRRIGGFKNFITISHYK